MKKTYSIRLVLLCVFIISSCSKDTSAIVPPSSAVCKPITESTNLIANDATHEYSYGTDGKIIVIKKFTGNLNQTLADSTVVSATSVIHYVKHGSSPIIISTYYQGGNLDGMPTEALVDFQEDGVIQTGIYHYYFSYDTKNRLNKVVYHTDHLAGDYEYDLNIVYDNYDNVSELRYEVTAGLNANTTTTIVASGYDDKPNPYAGIKNWYFLMHTGWDYSENEPLFTALSKNNLLGYNAPNGFKKTITYTYSTEGFPITRNSTNTNASGSNSFLETYNYQCQ